MATEASVGVTGIMAVLMEFKMADKKRYFFSCFLISVIESGNIFVLISISILILFKINITVCEFCLRGEIQMGVITLL